jgi:hypothetical protein
VAFVLGTMSKIRPLMLGTMSAIRPLMLDIMSEVLMVLTMSVMSVMSGGLIVTGTITTSTISLVMKSLYKHKALSFL